MQDFSIYITAGSWFTKVVEVDAVDGSEAFKRAHIGNPFPAAATFGSSDEPFEIDISDISEMSAKIDQLQDGRWRVGLVAQLHGAGTFLKAYADAEEATREGVDLFPGWPEEIEGWQFRSEEGLEVEEVSPCLKTGTALKDSAIAILENLYPEIEIALYQSGEYAPGALEGARETIEVLQKAVLDERVAVNPGYLCVSELAAELVYFAHTHPEHFAQVFLESEMTWHRDMDVRTPKGIFQLWSFYTQLCDDHSYSLDTSSEIPLLKGDWQFASFQPLTGPDDVLRALQVYRASVEQVLELQVAPSL
jgi:hypothetical protein